MITGPTASPGNGVVGPYSGNSLALRIVIATMAALSWYNAIELVILVFVTFSQFRGPYFWSLLISALGLIPYSAGFLLKYFALTSATALSITLITIGWYAMVTGQSVVLYSRLHLVLPNPKVLRRVLTMIIVNAFLLHIPTSVLTYGSNLSSHPAIFISGYNIMEKIQMTGFCLQEFILSVLYIWETIRMLRLDPDRGKRKIMYQLVAINLIIIALDLGLLVIEYRDLYILETMIKPVIYSVKLKLEFAVLGKLVLLVRSTHNLTWKPDSPLYAATSPVTIPPQIPCRNGDIVNGNFNNNNDLPDFVDATRVPSDLNHAAAGAAPRRRPPPRMDSEELSIAMFEHSESGGAGTGNILKSGIGRDRSFERDHGHSLDLPPTGHSNGSQSWSGETQTNNSATERELSPLDFTKPFGRQDSRSSF
ncbi:hypothetical protein AtubIFM56815_001295 [Aspergillus tubingensis]|uniref:DUF7703 domain-containing protein n=1 Tax=Aspergillus tubingensis TaxID=5068 RepID=A0A8H3SJ07_ASPTU|nr:uncharacterized protein AtWU_00265 [Aspergillus tubingensis]GFN10470.1 integral membrane protein [Aspergillus tubingensis]GLA59685.1 hypothetical protein AtubIFM54640_010998 [Aspergillus tubingensis]GLA80474.1 hypothetical protein AtubIFM56815_001295 [Aspergillus tubingensis]GLA93762.1 hypothetical protein AtubIFM57143_000610 [Aspergillus tubingensis]GLB22333.1 hypothetical protein AtubIFM61612_002896 [Aspergillus tubingensis]